MQLSRLRADFDRFEGRGAGGPGMPPMTDTPNGISPTSTYAPGTRAITSRPGPSGRSVANGNRGRVGFTPYLEPMDNESPETQASQGSRARVDTGPWPARALRLDDSSFKYDHHRAV